MATYEFQGNLYRTKTEMLDALASEFLSAGGMNDRHTMLSFFDVSDQKLADECFECWALDAPRRQSSWMAHNGVTREDIEGAFARLRRNFDEVFPAGTSQP